MYKVTISTGHKNLECKTLEEANEWIAAGVAGDWWGLADRWTRDEGSEITREVIDFEATEEQVVMQMQYDYTNPMEPVELEEIEVTIPAREAVTHTEYFYPAEYTINEPEDITAEVEAKKAINESITRGRVYKAACNDCLDYIGDYNVINDIDVPTLMAEFSDIHTLLVNGQPSKAKEAINLAVGYADLKVALLYILSDY